MLGEDPLPNEVSEEELDAISEERGIRSFLRTELQSEADVQAERPNTEQEEENTVDDEDAQSLSAMSDPALTADDFDLNSELGDSALKREASAEIDNLIGMGKAKLWFEQLKQKVAYVEATGDRTVLRSCLNMVRASSTCSLSRC